jgi:hypothetical protein
MPAGSQPLVRAADRLHRPRHRHGFGRWVVATLMQEDLAPKGAIR